MEIGWEERQGGGLEGDENERALCDIPWTLFFPFCVFVLYSIADKTGLEKITGLCVTKLLEAKA